MLFTSWQFAAFVVVVFFIYYLPIFQRFQVTILVVASIVFYALDQAKMLPLLLATVLGTYGFLLLALARKPFALAAGITFNLLILAFFKYKFLIIGPVTSGPDASLIEVLLALPLPIGISFFVFHNISLLVDYTKTAKEGEQPNIKDVFLYIAFFPQLVSGPIARASSFLPQINPKYLRNVPVFDATRWIIVGYFFKLFAANNLNQLTTFMAPASSAALGGFDRSLLVFLYSYQIYADFFGYSAIAVGLALLFGYRLPINFRLPYIAASFSEFWTRWHISLSTWLRTYLYIPLGGNRRGEVRTYINLMIVMGLGGLWHGAGLSYLVWGLLHGLFLVLERPFLTAEQRYLARPSFTARSFRALRILLTFGCVSFAWVFFKLPNFTQALDYLGGMFTHPFSPGLGKQFYLLSFAYSFPVIVQHGLVLVRDYRFVSVMEPYVYGLLVCLMILEAGPETSFIYFQF